MCSVEGQDMTKRVVIKRLPGTVQRPLPVSAPQVGAFDSGRCQRNVSRWVIPASRRLGRLVARCSARLTKPAPLALQYQTSP